MRERREAVGDDAAVSLNRRHWDDRAAIHARDATGFYRIVEFRAGGESLTPIESGEIGDVAGLSVLHLQCHLGLDTLSLARRGAEVTGLDFSPAAIAFARGLAAETGLRARFVEGDVHQVRAFVGGNFDLVFASWGVLCWIPDAVGWFAVAASMLKPGGRIYLADDHPLAATLEETLDAEGRGRFAFIGPWRTAPDAPLVLGVSASYTGDPAAIANAACRQWLHPFSEIIEGVTRAGLRIVFLHEHDRLPWRRFARMEPDAGGLWRLPAGSDGPPLAFSLMAVQPE